MLKYKQKMFCHIHFFFKTKVWAPSLVSNYLEIATDNFEETEKPNWKRPQNSNILECPLDVVRESCQLDFELTAMPIFMSFLLAKAWALELSLTALTEWP